MHNVKLNNKRNKKSKSKKRMILSQKIRSVRNNTDDFLHRLFSLNEYGALVIGGKRIC